MLAIDNTENLVSGEKMQCGSKRFNLLLSVCSHAFVAFFNQTHPISIRNRKEILQQHFYNQSAILSFFGKSQYSANVLDQKKNTNKRRTEEKKKNESKVEQKGILLIVKQIPFGFCEKNECNKKDFVWLATENALGLHLKNRKLWKISEHIYIYIYS